MNANEAEAKLPLTPLAYALLALVVEIGRWTHAYEIVKVVRARGGALGSSASTIYRQLKKLAADEYLEGRPAEINGRGGVAYRRTQLGVTALTAWAETPVRTPEVDSSELIPRLRAARLVPAKTVLRSLRPLQVFLEDDLDDLRVLERKETKAGNRDTFLELEFDLRRRLLRAYSDWNAQAIVVLERLAAEQASWSEAETEAMLDEWVKRTKNAIG